MSAFTEDIYEQNIIELFRDELGYEYECGYNVEHDIHRPCYEEQLEASLQRVNKDLSDYAISEMIRLIHTCNDGTLEQNNEIFMDWLQNGMEIDDKLPSGELKSTIGYLIDYDNIKNNDFRIVNQWTVEEYKNHRFDIVVFINGMPLVIFELKSAMAEGADVEDAYLQIRNYQQDVPFIFNLNCFNVISDFTTTEAGTITASFDRYKEWKTVDGSYETTLAADYQTFFCGIFDKRRFLDIICNFICFEHKDGKTIKFLAAYHQYYAVNKAMKRTYQAMNSDGKIGVFWHTQGSGKSLSMVFYAHLLIQNLPEVTIVGVTDRKDLDDQLYGQFCRCHNFLRTMPLKADARSLDEGKTVFKSVDGKKVEKHGLKNLLDKRKAGGIIFTTIQKFEENDEALSTRRNIIVMTDEAHRSQYGDEDWDEKSQTMKKGFALKMREALPGASFIGFTGTPINNLEKSTEEVFGEYIDIYDMTQAVMDEATRPVYYESRVVNLSLNEETLKKLDEEFDRLQDEGATEEQIKEAKREHSNLEQLLGDDTTINSLVEDIVKHYEENRQQVCSGKAMIVAYSRGIGIKIYQKLMQLRPEWKEKVGVVMSLGNQDPEEWRQIIGKDSNKKELAKDFKSESGKLKIVIVRDMWLTGFDVPSLATMYVYKPMSGHNLMQAIARVNRVFPDKEGGLIVDYVGIAQALKAAMQKYTKRDQSLYGDPDIAKTALVKWEEELEICQCLIYGYDYSMFFEDDNKKKSKAIQEGLNFMLGPKLHEKRKDFLEHTSALKNTTTLCRSLLTEKQKLEVCYFCALRNSLLRMSKMGKISKHDINASINELLRQSVKSEGVINLFSDIKTEFSLFDDAFMEEIRKMKEKNLAVELLTRLMKERIKTTQKTNIVQSDLFSDMLNKSLSNYLKGMLTNEEVIEELLKMAKQMKEDEEKENALGLTKEEKAFYDALSKPEGVRQAYSDDEFVELTKELTEALRKNRTIDWNHKESARAKMRVMVKRLLKKYKYPPKGAEEALETVMKQCDHWADNEDNFNDIKETPHSHMGYSMPEDEYAMAAEDLHRK